jgi:Protein of unknown function (DUF3616)
MSQAHSILPRLRPLPVLISTIWLVSFCIPAVAENTVQSAPELTHITPDPTVVGRFFGKGGSKPAKDLSGIACHPAVRDNVLDCLVVNDEGTAAQRVTVEGRTLRPGPSVPLVGNAPPQAALGPRPIVGTCPGGPGEFAEFDGEGVAFAASAPDGSAFYVVGSHGCSRKKGEFRLSSFLLARLRTPPSGELAPVELTWRLSSFLRNAKTVGAYFGRSLDAATQGLNIEGITAIGDQLLFGLRAPSRDGNAFIIIGPIADLFAPGRGEAQGTPKVFPVSLGANTGIRDMTVLPDGRLLVLSGPAQEQKEVPYALALVTLREKPEGAIVQWLGQLPNVMSGGERAKAEGITILSRDNTAVRVLVLFDGLENGGPREFQVKLP